MKNELDISGGTTRMESAFGSGDGDDEATASVAQKLKLKPQFTNRPIVHGEAL